MIQFFSWHKKQKYYTSPSGIKYDWEVVDEVVKELIEKKEIDKEDADAAKVCFASLLVGADKKRVKEIAICKDFEMYWNNIKKGGYFRRRGRIESIEKSDLPFLFMIMVAEGLLERKVYRRRTLYGLTEKGREKALKIRERYV